MAWKIRNNREVIIADENDAAWVTYIGKALLPSWVTMTQAKALPIWRIVKYVEVDWTSKLTYKYFPKDSEVDYSDNRYFVWDDRATLTWDA